MGAQGVEKTTLDSLVPVTHRQLVSQVPAAWLDRLLLASVELSPSATVIDAATALLDATASSLPGIAVGVCLAADDGCGQTVLRRNARAASIPSPDPTRLFPDLAVEHVIAVDGDEGSTLHVASDSASQLAEGSAAISFVDRVSLTLSAAIRNARNSERASRHAAELRGLQAQVIQTEKLASLGQIAAGIVHELNNPLTSIVAYSDYLRRKAERAGNDAADVERLRRINEAAERILRFSRDLIAYSRPSAEVPAPVAIHEIIDRALVFCEHVLEETGVLVERNFGEVRPVRGVPGQLTQVFVNLFTNAAQAMQKSGGSLRIQTRMVNDAEVAVMITDEGVGIEADNLPRIFEPFFTTKTDGSGTGLGLSIVRNIIQSHGGTIRAGLATPRGTVFFVELPIAAMT